MDSKFYFVYYSVYIKATLARGALSLKRQALIKDHPLQWQKDINDKYKNRSCTVISWQILSENEYFLYKNEIGNGREIL
uniref:Uncharacterized protein n=1 Tax=Marseillevirus LCMAC101 TaxID=2506602 RepID=A0A481YR59_9VIRU|nr:MAG: hypothetical protein LCMAC101_00570 [Marseillevirus LCMAC101]